MLSANVEQITDTVAVLECGAQGVGLFRTEHLLLDRKTLPNEEEQYTSYQRVAKAIAPEPVIFRTPYGATDLTRRNRCSQFFPLARHSLLPRAPRYFSHSTSSPTAG